MASLLLLGTAAALGLPQGAIADDAYYKIVVLPGADEKGQGRLKLFYQRLLTELRVDDLGYADIGCLECGNLDGLEPVEQLEFAMKREGLYLPAFILSYHHVQAQSNDDGSSGSETFAMTIDGTVRAGACPADPPPACRPRPICIQTSSCDMPYGGQCQKCIVP
jgi:hypothetical protein